MSRINQNWAFGRKAGLDFSTNPPTATVTGIGPVNTSRVYEGCACVSDANGTLLMYTDGVRVWDGGHNVKVTGLLGDSSSTQSAIIVPNSSNTDEYYVFTTDGSTGGPNPNHFNGVLINLATSSWVVTPLSSLTTLPSNNGYSPTERITAIQHANCKDFWIITVLQKGVLNTRIGPGVFRVFSVNSNGFSHVGDVAMQQDTTESGYLKGSPDGSMLALANRKLGSVLLYNFDNSTGTIDIANVSDISTKSSEAYGLEFSPDSKKMYYADVGGVSNAPLNDVSTSELYQVNLATLPLNPILIETFTNRGGQYVLGALQLGPDGRIYIVKDNEKTLAAILEPNRLGVACNVDKDFIQLQNRTIGELGLPNLIPNPCPDGSGTDCDCSCTGCNEDAEAQNEVLIDRAKTKFNTVKDNSDCPDPFMDVCELNGITDGVDFKPCFSFHWGDGANDQIEEHDTEVFYLTVCNPFKDFKYNGLRITKVTLVPDVFPIDKIHIVPDRFINFDCLEACSCQTREFAMITRANDTAGNYSLEVEYCFDSISLESIITSGKAVFPLEITED